MSNYYVLGFFFDTYLKNVLLIYKTGGPFPGRFNGIGGHIEKREDSYQAMSREFEEESGIPCKYLQRWELISDEYFPDESNYLSIFTGIVSKQGSSLPFSDIKEGYVQWMSITDSIWDVRNPFFAGCGNVPYYIYHALKHAKEWVESPEEECK